MAEGKICWDFPLLGTGNKSGSNIAAITMFKGAGVMDGIGRENGQNSSDAKDKDLPSYVPVKLEFDLSYIKQQDYKEVFDGYRKALDNCQAYWWNNPNSTEQIMDFIRNAQLATMKDEIPMLVVRDFNTTGLNGVNAAANEKSFWDLLVNTEGVSIKQDKDSAGSYGIGKNAPFAYSDLNLIFYNTLAKDGGRAFEGVTRLVTSQREYNGEMRPTQPIGKYLNLIDTFTGVPILPEDDCKIAKHPAFHRDEGQYGTDVAVVGFKIDNYPEWEKSLAVSMLKNFVMAIQNEKLEVVIKSDKKEYNLNKETMKDYLFKDFAEEEQLKYTRQIYETITEPDKPAINCSIAEQDDLTIYVKYKDSYLQSFSRFRSSGMLINTTINDVYPHFSVVVVANTVGNKELSETLKESEPPQHTEWKAKNIDDPTKRRKAAKFIKKIAENVKKVMESYDEDEQKTLLDSGTGGYLPDTTREGDGEEGTDALKTDVKIKEIVTRSGEILFDKRFQSGENTDGTSSQEYAHKTGKKKRKKKTGEGITVTTPPGNESGVNNGSGKIKYKAPNLTDHRTFYDGDGKYTLYVECPEDYSKVYVQYYAGRDDDATDGINVTKFTCNGEEKVAQKSGMAGPFALKKGSNTLIIEFDSTERMAVLPVFTMEVGNEE